MTSLKKTTYYIVLFFTILFCSCGAISKIGGTDLSSILNGPQVISTSFSDTKPTDSLLNTFGNNLKPEPLDKQPRNDTGAYILLPGFYEMTCRSYCLHAGTTGPSQGDGYLYAPLQGLKADVIRAIVKNSGKTQLPQSTVQLLIWAVLAKTSFKNLSPDLKLASVQLLSPKQLYELNGSALGLIPDAVLNKAIASLPQPIQQALSAENKLRQLLTQGNSAYADIEKIAVLNGSTGQNYPAGGWSKHPDGYYIRYFPYSYQQTRVQVYVPDYMVRNPNSSHPYTAKSLFKTISYDATKNVAVPANTGAQRLQQSGDDAGDGSTNNTPVDNSNPYDPCADMDPKNPANTNPLPMDERGPYQNKTNAEHDISNDNNWQPNQTGFETADGAGLAAIYYINQTSINQNVEYAGNIYYSPQTGQYYFSTPVPGTQDDSQPANSPVPSGDKIVATYHTHSGNYANSDEVLSSGDILKSVLSKLPAYLGTPEGKVLEFDPNQQSNTPCAATKNQGNINVLIP